MDNESMKSNAEGRNGNNNDNVRTVNKWRGYYMEDMDCIHCKYFISKKKGCKLDKCCCEAEKLDAAANGRIKRKRGAMACDG